MNNMNLFSILISLSSFELDESIGMYFVVVVVGWMKKIIAFYKLIEIHNDKLNNVNKNKTYNIV